MIHRVLAWLVVSMALCVVGTGAHATPESDATRAEMKKAFGFVPGFFGGLSDVELPLVWGQMKELQLNPQTKLAGKVKELIGLAVASQIPCHYCVYAHTKFAALNGASASEISAAIFYAGQTRFWSTWLNGVQVDDARFKAELAQFLDNAKKATSPPRDLVVTDARSARDDIRGHLGIWPSFLDTFPEVALASTWKAWRAADFAKGALDDKTKSLIGLAVSAQIPCRYCVMADTEFAKLGGASTEELAEAVAMASLTREFSTILNGHQVDMAAFRRDVDRLVANVKKSAATHP